MNPKRIFLIVVGFVILGLALWMGLYPTDWQNWLGFSQAAYFKYGVNYALLSGFMPCFVTAIGLSTLIVGAWHSVNCHSDGCARIGRHKINGTPWCNTHQEEARNLEGTDDLLRDILVELRGLKELMAERHE